MSRVPLKRAVWLNPETLPDETEPERPIRYIDIGNVQNGRVTQALDTTFEAAPSRARRLVKRGDVILSTVRTYLRAMALIEDATDVVVSTGFAVLRPRPGLDSGFLWYAVQSDDFVADVMRNSEGVSYPAIPPQRLGSLMLVVPELERQRAIADFLDRETTKIDALIAKRRRLGRLVREAFEAEITERLGAGNAVNWAVLPFGRIVLGIEQGWSPVAEDRVAEENEWSVVKLGAVRRGKFNDQQHKALPSSLTPDPRLEIRPGDFLLTRANTPELVGDVCVVQKTRARLMLSDLIYRLRLDPTRVNSQFVCYWLLSRAGRHQIEMAALGSSQSMVKIARGRISRWFLPVPSLTDQQSVVEQLDRARSRIEATSQLHERSIELAQEQRSAFITAAVTGQMDIRGRAGSDSQALPIDA